MTAFGTTFIVLTIMGGVWLTGIGAVLYAVNAFQHAGGAGRTVADGSILMTLLALALVINVAIAAPGLLMLQPFRLWRVVRNERRAITPRQRFRGRLSPSFFFCLYCFYLSSHPQFAFALNSRRGRVVLKWIPFLINYLYFFFSDSRLSRSIRPSIRDVVLHPRHCFRLGIRSNPSVDRTSGDPPAASDANW